MDDLANILATAQTPQDRAYVAKAVTLHNDLRAALDECLERLQAISCRHPGDFEAAHFMAEAREILARA